jgi:hypothetical protein
MKNLTYLFVFVISSHAIANEDCINKYKKKFFKNKQRYEKAVSRFDSRREAAQSHIYSAQATGTISVGALFGTATLQNDVRPVKSDYNLSGEPIIKAYDHNLVASSSRPAFLDELYNDALNVDADTTYEEVQKYLKKGMDDGEFCSFWGLKDKDKITKYVLQNLSKQRVVTTRDLSIVDSRADKVIKTDSVQTNGAKISVTGQ